MGALTTVRRQSGFTIIELIIVIAVIAILSGIMIVAYGSWQTSLKTKAIKNDLTAASSLMESKRNFNTSGGYPTSEPSFDRSANVSVEFTTLTTDYYCIDGFATDQTTIRYYIYSKTKDQGPLEGTCASRPDLTPPSAPTSVTSVSTDSVSATVSWVSVADAANYIVQCAADGGFIYNIQQITVAAGSGTIQGSVTGLTAGSPQFCRVKAINSKGASAWSTTATNNGTESILISQWTLNGNALDSVGNGDGIISGAVPTTGQNGLANGAYSFDGVDDYIEVFPTIPSYSQFSVSAWARVVSGPSATDGYGYIFLQSISNLVGQSIFWLASTASNFRGDVNGVGATNTTVTAPSSSVWRLLTITYNGTVRVLYVNGQAEATETRGAISNTTAGTRFSIGSSPFNPTFRPAQGAIDDVRIYSRALTASEVLNIYNQGAE